MHEQGFKSQFQYIYDEKGADKVSEQIVDAYNSGVIDREDGRYDSSDTIQNSDGL